MAPGAAAVDKAVLVLFDVDETLVHTGGAGARSWKRAFEALYDLERLVEDLHAIETRIADKVRLVAEHDGVNAGAVLAIIE